MTGRPNTYGNREWDARQLRVLTPFKLLPFFSVRVRFGVMLVNRDLVEVLARVRVVREHVGWSHFPVNRSEGSTGMGGWVFGLWEFLLKRINARVSFSGRQS
jgi:hypothetical protein